MDRNEDQNSSYLESLREMAAIPFDERSPQLDYELAHALFEAADRTDLDDMRTVLRLLQEREDVFGEDAGWNLILGDVCVCLGQYGRALPCYQRALETHPEKARIRKCMEICNSHLRMPLAERPFLDRAAESWDLFVELEPQLHSLWEAGIGSFDELGAYLQFIFDRTFDGLSFAAGYEGEKPELFLVPENTVELIEMIQFRSLAPRKVLDSWTITLGRAPEPEIGLRREDGWRVLGDEVQIWLERVTNPHAEHGGMAG